MRLRRPVLLLTGFCWLITLIFTVSSVQSGQDGPHASIRGSAAKLLATVDGLRAEIGDRPADDRAIREVIAVLEPTVDFEGIARAVMGKYSASASPEQLDRFAQVFRNSLVGTYLNSLLTFKIARIEVLDPSPDFDPGSNRSSVKMQATDERGQVFQLVYSMRRNNRGQWKVRNLIVDGINLGLTYRNQYTGAMARHGNNINDVIDSWNAEMVAH